jgi:hypothetical protein
LVFLRPKTLQLFSFSINYFLTSWWGSLVFLRPKTLQLFGFSIIWTYMMKLFHKVKRVVRTKLEIYVFISIIFLVLYSFS